MPAMISVDHLTFHYPGVRALDDVSFEIEVGTVTALVGPNGAGKTTLLSCLAALERPLAGQIVLNGISVLDEPRRSHASIGYLADFYGLYDELSVRRCLRYTAMAQGIETAGLDQAVDHAMRRVQLENRAGAAAGSLSRGLRQRLAIAQAIIHEPRVLLLDEPASGLDPEARQHLSELLLELRRQGMTIVVSSHILSELNEYSTHMLVLRGGRLIEHRRIDGQSGDSRRTLVVTLAAPAENFAARLQAVAGSAPLLLDATRAELLFQGGPAEQHQLLRRLLEDGLPVCGLTVKTQNLQQAYLGQPVPAAKQPA